MYSIRPTSRTLVEDNQWFHDPSNVPQMAGVTDRTSWIVAVGNQYGSDLWSAAPTLTSDTVVHPLEGLLISMFIGLECPSRKDVTFAVGLARLVLLPKIGHRAAVRVEIQNGPSRTSQGILSHPYCTRIVPHAADAMVHHLEPSTAIVQHLCCSRWKTSHSTSSCANPYFAGLFGVQLSSLARPSHCRPTTLEKQRLLGHLKGAAVGGWVEVLDCILDRIVTIGETVLSVEAQVNRGNDTLWYALAGGNKACIHLLLTKGKLFSKASTVINWPASTNMTWRGSDDDHKLRLLRFMIDHGVGAKMGHARHTLNDVISLYDSDSKAVEALELLWQNCIERTTLSTIVAALELCEAKGKDLCKVYLMETSPPVVRE